MTTAFNTYSAGWTLFVRVDTAITYSLVTPNLDMQVGDIWVFAQTASGLEFVLFYRLPADSGGGVTPSPTHVSYIGISADRVATEAEAKAGTQIAAGALKGAVPDQGGSSTYVFYAAPVSAGNFREAFIYTAQTHPCLLYTSPSPRDS